MLCMIPSLHHEMQVPVSILGTVLAGFSYGTGVGSVPLVLMSEMFPQKIKSWGLAFSLSTRSILMFLNIKESYTVR